MLRLQKVLVLDGFGRGRGPSHLLLGPLEALEWGGSTATTSESLPRIHKGRGIAGDSLRLAVVLSVDTSLSYQRGKLFNLSLLGQTMQ